MPSVDAFCCLRAWLCVNFAGTGVPLLERHRTVHTALEAQMADVHALTMTTRTPAQHAKLAKWYVPRCVCVCVCGNCERARALNAHCMHDFNRGTPQTRNTKDTNYANSPARERVYDKSSTFVPSSVGRPSSAESDVQSVRLSRMSCMISVASLYSSSCKPRNQRNTTHDA
jgi:hypothetical protein